MRTLATVAAALLLCLTLTGCPGSMTVVRPQLGPVGVSPTGLVFTSRSISLGRGSGVPYGDPSRITPFPFYLWRYTLKSGDEIVWEIERDPAQTCTHDQLPATISYGITPPCFRETVRAKPLERGRPYRLEDAVNKLDFSYDDPIQMLSDRGYAVRTRKWRNAHASGIRPPS